MPFKQEHTKWSISIIYVTPEMTSVARSRKRKTIEAGVMFCWSTQMHTSLKRKYMFLCVHVWKPHSFEYYPRAGILWSVNPPSSDRLSICSFLWHRSLKRNVKIYFFGCCHFSVDSNIRMNWPADLSIEYCTVKIDGRRYNRCRSLHSNKWSDKLFVIFLSIAVYN